MAAQPISPLSLPEYRALVTNIPLYCADATFTVADCRLEMDGRCIFDSHATALTGRSHSPLGQIPSEPRHRHVER
jgi:hypothetical protein